MTDPQTPLDPENLEQSIIDRFLALDPGKQRIQFRPDVEAPQAAAALMETVQGYAEPAVAEAEVRVLIAAGRRAEAARILLKLSVQMPEKSAYFADLLDNRAHPSDTDL